MRDLTAGRRYDSPRGVSERTKDFWREVAASNKRRAGNTGRPRENVRNDGAHVATADRNVTRPKQRRGYRSAFLHGQGNGYARGKGADSRLGVQFAARSNRAISFDPWFVFRDTSHELRANKAKLTRRA